MRHIITILAAMIYLAVNVANAQVTQSVSQHTATSSTGSTTLVEVQQNGHQVVVTINNDHLKNLIKKATALATNDWSVRNTANAHDFSITISREENNTFRFLGDEYKTLQEIDDEIEEKEQLRWEQGYFRFMGEWYPSLELVDSTGQVQAQQAGSFRFMGEKFAPMPGELDFPNA